LGKSPSPARERENDPQEERLTGPVSDPRYKEGKGQMVTRPRDNEKDPNKDKPIKI